MQIDDAFARAVRVELADRELTIPWLASASGIPARTLRSILSSDGQATTKLHQVCAISTALGVPCAEMVARAHAILEH